MTEQQADALMEMMVYCSDPHKYWGSFKTTDVVDAVTALCRHRDGAIYSQVIWYLPLEEVKRFDDMQTWGEEDE